MYKEGISCTSKILDMFIDKIRTRMLNLKNKYKKPFVQNNEMERSDKKKYFGETLSSSGTNKENLESRINKGYGMVVNEVPLGKHKLEIGLLLRQAIFLKGTLYDSEAWSNLTENEVKKIEKIDEYLLHSLLKGH